MVVFLLGGGGGIRTVQCFHCIWYPNPELTSAKNASEICRQHSFKLPMIIESCELGCVVSAVHTTGKHNPHFFTHKIKIHPY